ncbi:MAG: protein-L-isoaspartate(D-aspartate) O-methyltransferase [Anaerolineae bacterium]
MKSKASCVWMLLLVLVACDNATPQASPMPTQTPTLTRPTATAMPEPSSPPPTADRFVEERMTMVDQTIAARGVDDPDVLEAMRSAPRHRFVSEQYVDSAYGDHPLPIGYGQTISQPYMVAWMTELLELEPGEKVLEIGTGSGYQAAVLAELDGVEVYTIEIVPDLAEQAQERLEELGYTDVQAKQGDGYYGWPEHAPYDAIVVTAAPDHLPQPLVEQLAEGGSLVIPMGPPGGYQELWRFEKEDGELQARSLGGVMFVPFTGEGIRGD